MSAGPAREALAHDLEAFAAHLALRDPLRCFRCGWRLCGGHRCPLCPNPGCERDEDHDGECGGGIYTRVGDFVPAPKPRTMLDCDEPPGCIAGGVTTRADVAPPQGREVATLLHRARALDVEAADFADAPALAARAVERTQVALAERGSLGAVLAGDALRSAIKDDAGEGEPDYEALLDERPVRGADEVRWESRR